MAQQGRSGRSKVAGTGGSSGGGRPSASRNDDDAGGEPDPSPKAFVDLIGQRMIDQLGVVMLTKERIEETVGDAVSRGRVTTDDAQALVASLLERGRKQTGDLLGDIEQLFDKSRQELEGGAKRARRKSEDAARRARQQVEGAKSRARKPSSRRTELAIDDYEELTAAQIKSRLAGLSPAELRAIRNFERRHGNRKSVLKAIQTQLG